MLQLLLVYTKPVNSVSLALCLAAFKELKSLSIVLNKFFAVPSLQERGRCCYFTNPYKFVNIELGPLNVKFLHSLSLGKKRENMAE